VDFSEKRREEKERNSESRLRRSFPPLPCDLISRRKDTLNERQPPGGGGGGGAWPPSACAAPRPLPAPVLPPFCPRFAPLLPLCFPLVCGILVLCWAVLLPPGFFLRSALFLCFCRGCGPLGGLSPLSSRCGVAPPAVGRVALCGCVGVALAPGGGFAPASFARVRSRSRVGLAAGVAAGGWVRSWPARPPALFPALPVWWCVVLVSVRSLAFSAFRSGGLVSVLWRPSSRSLSGFVLVARFSRQAPARAFACRWARRLGVSVVVGPPSSGFAVRVPAPGPGSSRCPSFGRLVVSSGGLRGFLRSLAGAGLVAGSSCSLVVSRV
jgi:hypothetical protein